MVGRADQLNSLLGRKEARMDQINEEPEAKYENLKKKYKALREVSPLLHKNSRVGVYESIAELGRKSSKSQTTQQRTQVRESHLTKNFSFLRSKIDVFLNSQALGTESVLGKSPSNGHYSDHPTGAPPTKRQRREEGEGMSHSHSRTNGTLVNESASTNERITTSNLSPIILAVGGMTAPLTPPKEKQYGQGTSGKMF